MSDIPGDVEWALPMPAQRQPNAAPEIAGGDGVQWALPHPQQSLTAGTPQTDSILARNRWDALKSGAIDDRSASAEIATNLAAGMSPDPQKQLQIYARSRGLPVERYGYDREGNAIYIDMDGRLK